MKAASPESGAEGLGDQRGPGRPWWPQERIAGLVNRHRQAVAVVAIMASLAFLIPRLDAPMQGDVRLYQKIAVDTAHGKMPYRDRIFEYPPYAIPLFQAPSLTGKGNYLESFMVFVLAGDVLVKMMLISIGFRHGCGARSILPLAGYCAAMPFLGYFYLQRFDIFPALACLAVVWLACSEKYFLGGLGLAAGIGVKLYPVLWALPLFVLAYRQGKSRQFLIGLSGGLLPIALLGFFLPWWRFAEFQSARGIHVESLWASLIWLWKLLGQTELHWASVQGKWTEVHGPLAITILPWARGVFLLSVLVSVLVSAWAAARCRRLSIGRTARILLVPILAFVVFNQVFSPQYLIWLLPLTAVSCLEGSAWSLLAILSAVMLTPILIPALHYGLFDTTVLLARNLLLVGAWGALVREIFGFAAPDSPKLLAQSSGGVV